MADNKPLYDLYKGLRADNYDVPESYESFERTLTKAGKTGAASRHTLYEALKRNNYDVPERYESFYSTLFEPVNGTTSRAKGSYGSAVAQKPAAAGQKPAATGQASAQVKPQPAASAQKPATTASAAPAKAKGQEAAKLTPAEMVGYQMMAGDIIRQSQKTQQDFSKRMENIRKGNTPGKTSGMAFNPTTGRMERKYYTTGGDEAGSMWEQSAKNIKRRDEWEATTPEGQAHRERRMQGDYEGRVGAVMDKFDPDNAAEQAWQNAEARTLADRNRHNKEIWGGFAALGGGREARAMATGETRHSNMVDHLRNHDLQRMADEAWNMLGKEKQQAITNDIAEALHNRYPEATDEQIRQAAAGMARERSDQRLYELAVKKNAPQSATEWFFRKAIGDNSLMKLHQALARSEAGTTGDWAAREVAEQEYNHGAGRKAAGIAGTVVGFALDPLTVVSAGAGSGVTKGAMWLGGKAVGEAAMRKGAATLGGRLAMGAVGGAANFGTFEAGSEAVEQLKWGGHRDETGAVGKYSLGAVGERLGHGLVMGAATGVIAPLVGNVSDKLVRATESTAGKAAIRAGEIGVGTVAEGTIFSIPEWMEGQRDAMDVWTDNMAMMAGFKLQHGVKSAPRVIAELSRDPRGRKAGFETRLRSALDGSRPDLALTKDEKAELERGGYTDLTQLTEDYGRHEAEKARQEKQKGQKAHTADPGRMIAEGEMADGVSREIPFNRFEDLMNDGRVSEAARAKMYYYLTGRTLPMSTVMGSSVVENKDADGNVKGYTVRSFGANGVITSRSFADKGRADVEARRINRQAELNTIDVGERHFDWKGDNQRMWEACQAVAEETGAPANRLYELMRSKPETMNGVELEWARKIMDAHDQLGDKYGSSEVRTAINEEYGVDVDKAIRKEPGRRSEQEQKALEEYAKRLFADIKMEQEDAAQGDGQNGLGGPNGPDDADGPNGPGWTDGQAGATAADPTAAVRQRGYDADAQERRDIAIELARDGNAEAQEAWDGVVERINDDADYQAAQKREVAKKMRHADGSIHPALLKEQDADGHNKVVYIVDGEVTMMDDGSMVDKTRSDKSVAIYDPATDERKMIDPSADTGIKALQEAMSAEAYDVRIESERQEYVRQQLDDAQGKVRLAPGQQITLPTGEDAVVMATEGDNVTVRLADGYQRTVGLSDLQRISDEKALADYNERHGIKPEQGAEAEGGAEQSQDGAGQEPVTATARGVEYGVNDTFTFLDGEGATIHGEVQAISEDGVEIRTDEPLNGKRVQVIPAEEFERRVESISDADGNPVWARERAEEGVSPTPLEAAQGGGLVTGAPADYTPDMEITVRDDDGTEKPAMVMGRVRYENGAFVPDENGSIVEYYMDGEVKHDHEDKLRGKVVSHAEAGRTEAEGSPVVEEEPKQEGAPAESAVPAAEPKTEAPVEQTQASAKTEDVEAAREAMPMREDGEEDWQATTPERAHQYIYNETDLSRSEANQFVAANADAAGKALAKAQSAQMPQVGTSIQKYNQAKAKRQEKIDEAQRAVDYWNRVREMQDGIQREENERREAEEGLNDEEADELLSRMENEPADIPQLELNPKNWIEQFGEDGKVSTPMGKVKMGENQIAKLFEKGRSEQFGMIKPTLEHPQVVVEVPSEAADGSTERASSLLFIKTFQGKDGKKVYYFKSVTVKKDGLEVSVSSHYDRAKRVKEALKKGKLLYRFDGGAQTERHPADVSVTTSPESSQGKEGASSEGGTSSISHADNAAPAISLQSRGDAISSEPKTTGTSASKDNDNPSDVQGKTEKNADEAALERQKSLAERKRKARERAQRRVEAQRLARKRARAEAEKGYDMEPHTPTELAASMLGGGSIKLERSSFLRHTGYGNAEARRMLGLLASREKGGMTMEEAGEQVLLADEELGYHLLDHSDANAGLDAVIDALHECRTKGELQKYILNNRIREREGEEEAEREREEAARDEFYYDQYHLTYDEYVIYTEEVLPLYYEEESRVPEEVRVANLEEMAKMRNDYENNGRETGGHGAVREERLGEQGRDAGGDEVGGPGGEDTPDGQMPDERRPVLGGSPRGASDRGVEAVRNGGDAGNGRQAGSEEAHTEKIAAEGEGEAPLSAKIDWSTREEPPVSEAEWMDMMRFEYEGKTVPEAKDMRSMKRYVDNVLSGDRGIDQTTSATTATTSRSAEVPASGLYNSEVAWFSPKKYGDFIAFFDEGEKAVYKLSARRDGRGRLQGVTLTKETFGNEGETSPSTSAGENKAYTITPTTYTNKKGKTTPMHLVKFDHELTKEQKSAGKELAKESRGWWDSKQGGFMMRSEEAARELAEVLGSEEAVQDAQPMSAKDMEAANDKAAGHVANKKAKTEKKPQPGNRVDMEETAQEQPQTDANETANGEAKQEKTKTKSKWVDDADAERFEELRKRLRMKLGGQLNMGIDPEAFSIGVEMSFLMLKHGARKFSEYAKNMIEALGENVRPYLKSFYNGARDLPEMADLEKELTPYDEVRAFDVKNFDKKGAKDLVATAEHIVREQAVEREAKEATDKLKSQRNEQRKEADEQRAADTVALAAETETDISEAETHAKTSEDRRAVSQTAGRVDDDLDKVNGQLALLGYYEAGQVAKDYDEAYGYMRNAEKKAVKDATNLASQLVDDLGLDRYEATHGAANKNGNRKTKPLAVANIAPAGGDITMHLPLAEGRELYVNVQLIPAAAKGVTNFGGDNLAVSGIMFRVDNPSGKGGDRHGRNEWLAEDVTYGDLLDKVQRAVYKYIPKRADVAEGEYRVGDKVEYTTDGGKTWHDAVVAQPNDMGGIRIDTGLAPAMWVNAKPDQLRHKSAQKADVDAAVDKAKADMAAKLEHVKSRLDKKILSEQIAQREKFIDELGERVKNGERIGPFAGTKNVDLQSTLLKCIGEREALNEALDHLPAKPSTESLADNPRSWVGRTFTYGGTKLVCKAVDGDYATFENKSTYMGMGFDVATVRAYIKLGKFKAEGAKPTERIVKEAQEKQKVQPVGTGAFGDVYDQFKGDAQGAIEFLKARKGGEAVDALHHKDIGYISLVWGNDKAGLKKILWKHPEVASDLQAILDRMQVVQSSDNRIVLESETHKAVVSKMLGQEKTPQWLLTAYEKKNASGGSSDIVPEPQRGMQNGTAPLQDNSSNGKVTRKSADTQAKGKKKVKPEQQAGDLFAGLFDEPVKDKDNGLERNHDAVRAEGLPADRGGQQQGLRGGEGAARQEAAQEGGRPDGRREGQGAGDAGPVSAGLHGLTEAKNTRNNRSERGADHAPTTVNGRIEANVKAIRLARELLESGETATPEQMAVLRQFSGWGGLGGALDYTGSDWKVRERNKQIRELLGEEAYEQAVMSSKSAYYTPAYVVDTLWDIARQLGFKGGHILEGSAGIGNILGQMPAEVSGRSDIHAIEIDGTSGGILSLLYPDAKVDIQGFEETRIPNGSVDLAITNVPFVTGLHVKDKTGDGDLSRKFRNIHDFCIAKNVRKLREGGLGIFISSNGTLDNSKALRDWVVNEGGSDFIGAFRMNNETFGGTPVTSDIIVIRKRVNGQKSPQAIDVSAISGERTAEYQEPGARKAKQLSMDYNKYFIEHPDHMAGEMRFGFEEGDKTYRPTSKGLYPVSGKDQGAMLADFVKTFTEEAGGSVKAASEATPNIYEELGEGVKEGSMVVDKNGNICTAHYGKAVPVMSKRKTGETATDEELVARFHSKKIKGHTKQECFNAYSAIKSALADVMEYQTTHEDNAGLQPLLAKLNKAYDDFVATYGHFNKNNQLAWLRRDVDYPNVFSLETYEEQGDGKGGSVKTYGKADVLKGRVVEKERDPHPETVKDGVVVSMFKNGRIDIPYIAGQLGKSEEAVKREIIDGGLGFEDPATRQVEVSYQYLSGNVREKLRQAEANNENGEYTVNIKALRDVVPMDIPAHLIDFTLGSSWLDPKLYDAYVKDRTDIDVHFTAAGGSWYMKAPSYGLNVEKNRSMGVTSEMLDKTVMGHVLIEAAIQNKTIVVSQTKRHYDGTTETITDREATAACASKIDEIRQDFKEWARQKMQSDADLSARIEREYNDRFNNYVPMRIPDEFVPEFFGGATHKFKMRPHQGKAIVRGTMQPLLLAHEVGTGKTFTLISTAMEMRRLGTARKPMIVVQNATVGQFAASAKELYPNAKILTLEDNDRDEDGRKNFYAKIKYNDWDMIVVPQSTFEFIPDSDERQMQFIRDKIEEKMLVLEQMREADDTGRSAIVRNAEKELASLQAELAEKTNDVAKKRAASEKQKAVARQNASVKAQEMLDRRTDDVENFDDMGIDALLIDEAHEYKHLGFATAMQRGVKGVDPSFSKKSQGVYLKTQAVLEKMGGRNVVFATGTPISNTAAEIWTFMRYLMPRDTMKEYGIQYFDDFVRNFGNIQQMPEFKTSGKFQEVNRFAGYVNLPELVRIWSGAADTVLTKDQEDLVEKIPAMEGGKAQDIYLPQTRALRSVMKYVREQLEEYEKMSGKEKKENSHIPLTMYGIAQGAAVDARLVQVDAEDDPKSKTNEAVRQTLRSLKETDGYKGTVAIFADHYMNKRNGFNLYEDIKKKLVAQGVPASEVVVMKSGMKIKQKLDIFEKVNRGEVRVIMGSTATLGTGVNIQERLHTLIHLDAPNRPMDYTQRNGRILRQGNLHKQWDKPVRVLRFGVEDSLDVTAYQRLKTKGAIADSIMEGDRLMKDSMNNRVLEEEEDVFGDTVAQLSGSEYALLKNNAEKNVRKYESRKRQWEADQTYIHNAKPKLEGQIRAADQRAEEAKAHLQAVQEAFPDGTFTEITAGKHKFGTVDAMADFIKEHNKKILDAMKTMKETPGSASQTHKLTLSLGGYDFTLKTDLTRETVNGGGTLFAEVHRKMTYSCPELGLEDVPVKQALLRNAVEDITDNVITGKDFAERLDYATRAAAHGRSELEQLKQREGKPFEFGKELEEAKRQLEEYTEAMKEELAAKEKKYAEMDASVEAATDLVVDDDEADGDDNVKFRLLDDDDPKALELEKMGYRFELDGKELTPEESRALDERNWEDRDVIPGREGHVPFVSNEDIARINAKMSGKWVGEPKAAMESAMTARVNELSERLHTPVRIIRTDEEVAALPSARQRRMKGCFNPVTGEVTIVVPNNANVADVENTFVHEVVGHDGLRVLFPEEEKLTGALDELYRVSNGSIQQVIDRRAQKMYDAEVDRLRERKRKAHEAKGEDGNASYYVDMAEAHAEASKKREQFRRDTTEEYGADLAGRIGEEGFEKMSAEELTFWGKLKAMLQKALQRLLEGLKIPGSKKWSDKEWAFVLHEAYKRKKNGGKPDLLDAADTVVMREKTGFGEEHEKSAEHGEARLNAFQLPSDARHNVQPSEAAPKHLEPTKAEHGAKVLQNREKTKEALANVADAYRKVTDTKGFLTALKDAMGLTGNGSSAYRSFELPNGDTFVMRVSNHNAKAHNAKDGERVESIVIKRKHSPNSFEPAAGKKVDEYVYFKEDIRKAPAGTLSSIAESISELLDTGEYHDKTGLAKDNHSPETDLDGGIMFRDGDSEEYEKALARDVYEQRVSRGMYQTQEALQDSMLGLKEAMDAVLKAEGKGKTYIEDVAGYENAYLGENRLSSVNQAECAAFAQTLFKPMLEEVAKMAKTADERAALTDYMMAKHGLERNEVMARRAADRQAEKEFSSELLKAARALAKDPLNQDAADALDDVRQRRDEWLVTCDKRQAMIVSLALCIDMWHYHKATLPPMPKSRVAVAMPNARNTRLTVDSVGEHRPFSSLQICDRFTPILSPSSSCVRLCWMRAFLMASPSP